MKRLRLEKDYENKNPTLTEMAYQNNSRRPAMKN